MERYKRIGTIDGTCDNCGKTLFKAYESHSGPKYVCKKCGIKGKPR